MILADENIDSKIIEAIQTVGIDVYSIAETHSGVVDEEIMELS
ncbi:hypothetical protein BH23BAC1_BH23BAC1_05710 [soil metagenome]